MIGKQFEYGLIQNVSAQKRPICFARFGQNSPYFRCCCVLTRRQIHSGLLYQPILSFHVHDLGHSVPQTPQTDRGRADAIYLSFIRLPDFHGPAIIRS